MGAPVALRAALMAAALVAVVPPAGAAEPAPAVPSPAAAPAAPPSPAVKAEARERFDRGVRLFEQGQNAGALAEFKRTYQLIPNPLVLYNMGLVYAAMNRPVEAADALDEFLGQSGTLVPPEKRKHAETVRDEQSKRIAQLMVLSGEPATIEIDGIEAGRTPLSKPIRLSSGAHVVTVLAPGFLPVHKEVTLPGQTTETLSLTLLPTETRLAQLVVRSALPGADVVVNGKRVGVTPLPASVAVAPGEVHVELRRLGYRAASRTITLDAGARGEVALAPEPDPAAPAATRGRLAISASVPDADAVVDGGPRRPIAGVIELPAGAHLVRLERPGYEPAERTVDVPAGGEAPLVVTLVPTTETRALIEEGARTRRRVGWSMGAAGAALLVGGGIYAAVSQRDVADADSALTALLKAEAVPGALCYNTHVYETMMDYRARGCPGFRADAEQALSDAQARRNWSIGVAALGAVVGGVGTYLLLTAGRERDPTSARAVAAAAWSDGTGGGLLVSGRF